MKIFGKVISVSDAGDEMKKEPTAGTAADPNKESNEKEKEKQKPVKGRVIRILKGIGFAAFAAICAALGFKFRGTWDRVSEALGESAIPEIVDATSEVAATVEPEIIDVATEVAETVADTVTEEM